jgi:tRNA nucleotidyltransferase (CCA-adding enzyme)
MTSLPKKTIQIIQKTSELLDVPIYLVGGAVRDSLLQKTPKDWDFATPILPDEIQAVLEKAGRKPYLIGKKFGTIGFKLELEKNEFEYIEVTTFRGERYEYKNRKPEVTFSTKIDQDLSRRDFSINAMAIDSNLKIIDFFDGQKDLENRIVKCVGKPKIRFNEDSLRILRAIRFATQLDFEIEQKTWEKLSKMKFNLLDISKERWVMELDKILGFQNVQKGLDLLMESGCLGVMIPELILQKDYDQNTPYHDFDLWTHTKKVVSGVPKENVELRWAGLLHDIAKPFTRTENKKGHSNYINHHLLGAEMAKKVCNYLKFSTKRTDYIVDQILCHLETDSDLKIYDDNGKKF